MEKNNVGFAVWCVIYSVLVGVDEGDGPIEADRIYEIDKLLYSSKFITALGMTKKEFNSFVKQAEKLVDEEAIYDKIEFYDDYAEILKDTNYKTQAKDILNVICEKYPDKADDFRKIMSFAGIR